MSRLHTDLVYADVIIIFCVYVTSVLFVLEISKLVYMLGIRKSTYKQSFDHI